MIDIAIVAHAELLAASDIAHIIISIVILELNARFLGLILERRATLVDFFVQLI